MKKELMKFIAENTTIECTELEKQYMDRHELIQDGRTVTVMDGDQLFSDAVIERCDKETEDLLSEESFDFLKNSITYLKQNQAEFIYIEVDEFERLGVDAISLELDDVFENYSLLCGVRLQKKYGPAIMDYLNAHLQKGDGQYSILFSDKDGLFDVNFAINYVNGFAELQSIHETLQVVYTFLFNMLEAIEEGY